jgi:hypothetical protein
MNIISSESMVTSNLKKQYTHCQKKKVTKRQVSSLKAPSNRDATVRKSLPTHDFPQSPIHSCQVLKAITQDNARKSMPSCYLLLSCLLQKKLILTHNQPMGLDTLCREKKEIQVAVKLTNLSFLERNTKHR